MAEAPVLTNLVNLQNETTAVNAINANNAAINTAFTDVLSLSGTAPNQMQSPLDMNSNRILNLPTPINGNEPLRLTDASTLNGGGTIATLPVGGTTGQTLAKNSNANYDTKWSNAGAGTVSSVGLSLPGDFTVSGTPVTGSGTLTASYATTPTGTGALVKANSPTLVTPNLGTPSALLLTNATGLSLTTGVVGQLANGSLAPAPAFSIMGNASNFSTTPSNILINALVNKPVPLGGDVVLISDQSAGGALKYATVATLGSASGVSGIDSLTGAFTTGSGITSSGNVIHRALNEAVLQVNGITQPASTISTTLVMAGIGGVVHLTPVYSTRIKVIIQGVYFSSTGTPSVSVQLKFGTGTAPANGAANIGTVACSSSTLTCNSATSPLSFVQNAIVTGLTPGTAYWFDLAFQSSSGSFAVNLGALSATLQEI